MLKFLPWKYTKYEDHCILERPVSQEFKNKVDEFQKLSPQGPKVFIYFLKDFKDEPDKWSVHCSFREKSSMIFDRKILKSMMMIDLLLLEYEVEVHEPFVFPEEFLLETDDEDEVDLE